VAFVNHYVGRGGAEEMLLTLLEHLDRSLIDPVLLVPGPGDLPDRAAKAGTPVRYVPVDRALLEVARGGAGSRAAAARAAAASLAAAATHALAIRRARADLVVTNSAKAHVYGSVAGALARRPVVWRMHDTIDSPDFAGAMRRLLVAVGARIPRRVLAVSDTAGAALVRAGVPQSKVVVLYNGLPLDALEAAPARPEGPPTVGMIGRLTPLKGHDVFLEAAARLAAGASGTRFLIAGAAAREAPDYAGRLAERARELGIGDALEIESPFADLAATLARLDVVVHPAVLPDSLPTTIIEAMAMSRPVVGTDLGGLPELIEEGRSGLLVPPEDPAALADAVAAVLADPAMAARMGAEGRAEAEARFEIGVFAAAFARHLREVAAA
jgi:glycosyltransferase involved in cell wall biosynthesis